MRRKARTKDGQDQGSSTETGPDAGTDSGATDATVSVGAAEAGVDEGVAEGADEAVAEGVDEDVAEAGDEPETDPAASDHEEAFWGGGALAGGENDEAFAVVIDLEGDHTIDSETLEYMGSVPRTRVAPEELTALAEWAESKACRMCRRKITEHHDPAQLRHDECRNALRISRLLRRYT